MPATWLCLPCNSPGTASPTQLSSWSPGSHAGRLWAAASWLRDGQNGDTRAATLGDAGRRHARAPRVHTTAHAALATSSLMLHRVRLNSDAVGCGGGRRRRSDMTYVPPLWRVNDEDALICPVPTPTHLPITFPGTPPPTAQPASGFMSQEPGDVPPRLKLPVTCMRQADAHAHTHGARAVA